jgi:hypothetical protein
VHSALEMDSPSVRLLAMRARPNPIAGVLVDELNNAFVGRSWHGASLMGSLRGVEPTQATKSPSGRKTIWQQALHAAYWKHRGLVMLGEPATFPRKPSNWPKMPAEPSLTAWRADLRLLQETHARLIACVGGMGASRLDGRTRWLIHGLAAHDLYHAGQIKLLRRLIGR